MENSVGSVESEETPSSWTQGAGQPRPVQKDVSEHLVLCCWGGQRKINREIVGDLRERRQLVIDAPPLRRYTSKAFLSAYAAYTCQEDLQ